MKEAELETARESLRTIKLDNARRIMELSHEFPDWSDEMLVTLAINDQDKLIPRIAERKLVGVEILEGGLPKDDKAA